MKLSITFRRFETSESLKQYAHDKVERVKRYLNTDIEAHVVLSLVRHLHHADVTVYAGPFVLRGSEESTDMYTSIDLAMEKIQRQLKRTKEKLRHHHDKLAVHHGEALLSPKVRRPSGARNGKAARDISAPRVIRTNEIIQKPLSLEEAMRQLDLDGRDFLVFTNAQSRAVNVMYRRPDGHYGLVEAPAQTHRSAAAR